VGKVTVHVLDETQVNVPFRVQKWNRPPGLSGRTEPGRIAEAADAR
jgi:hypothetical protein